MKKASLRDPTSTKCSLFGTINKCLSPFGKRLLRQWVCAPSCDPEVLKERQDAIEFLLTSEAQELKARGVEALKKVPDLERLLQKIHTMGLKYRVDKHPDGRAQLYEAPKYNKRKINDLLAGILFGID